MPMPAANLQAQPRARHLAIAEADQALQRVGAAPLLLAASGTVALLGDDPEAVSQVALASLVAPPLATVGAVGAAGRQRTMRQVAGSARGMAPRHQSCAACRLRA